jgi:hypothetical protein
VDDRRVEGEGEHEIQPLPPRVRAGASAVHRIFEFHAGHERHHDGVLDCAHPSDDFRIAVAPTNGDVRLKPMRCCRSQAGSVGRLVAFPALDLGHRRQGEERFAHVRDGHPRRVNDHDVTRTDDEDLALPLEGDLLGQPNRLAVAAAKQAGAVDRHGWRRVNAAPSPAHRWTDARGEATSRAMTDAPRRLLLVDGSGYIFRAFFALPPMTRPDGTPINAVYGFCDIHGPAFHLRD